MADSIAGYLFDGRLTGGDVDDVSAPTTREITRAGTDGHAFHELGQHSEPFTLRGKAVVASAAAARTRATALKNLQSTLVTLSLTGVSNTVFVRSVKALRRVPTGMAVGGQYVAGAKGYLVETEFVLQRLT